MLESYYCETCGVSTPPMSSAEAKAEWEAGHVLTVTVTSVFGQQAQAKVYPLCYDDDTRDGFACPFCGSVTRRGDHPGWPRCANPWCVASVLPTDAQAASTRAVFVDAVHTEALRLEEQRAASVRHAQAMQRLRDEQDTQARVTAERRQQATDAGQCVTCAVRDYYRPRFVRHRDGQDCKGKK